MPLTTEQAAATQASITTKPRGLKKADLAVDFFLMSDVYRAQPKPESIWNAENVSTPFFISLRRFHSKSEARPAILARAGRVHFSRLARRKQRPTPEAAQPRNRRGCSTRLAERPLQLITYPG